MSPINAEREGEGRSRNLARWMPASCRHARRYVPTLRQILRRTTIER